MSLGKFELGPSPPKRPRVLCQSPNMFSYAHEEFGAVTHVPPVSSNMQQFPPSVVKDVQVNVGQQVVRAPFHSLHYTIPFSIKFVKQKKKTKNIQNMRNVQNVQCLSSVQSEGGPGVCHYSPVTHFPPSPLEGTQTLPVESRDVCSAGPLAANLNYWRECSPHPWVLLTVKRGYRLQFRTKPPPFNRIVQSQASGDAALVLEEEISSLLQKNAIQLVPKEKSQQGFYSRYFVIPKKGGGLRPILDLRLLNKHLRKYSFKMLSHKTLVQSIRPNDWFTTCDLTDAYYHIQIFPPHRKYLRFAFRDKVYEFLVVPFGLSLAPRLFTKCAEAALYPLRARGIRILTFLDDWLLCASSAQEAARDTAALLTHLTALGFSINERKSCLEPAQDVKFLGLQLNSVSYRATLSLERITAFRQCLALFQRGSRLRYHTCLRLLGLMASTIAVVPLGLLQMRAFQRWVSALRLCPKQHLNRLVLIDAACIKSLKCWRSASLFSQGTPLGMTAARKVISTDSSLVGWGATYEGRCVSGRWPPHLQDAHINYLELMAVLLALKHFLPLIRGQHVLVRSDNTTTVAYINRQGGTRSLCLHRLAHRLLTWSASRFLSLRATHIPGALNSGADLLSRGNPLYGEWTLHPQVVKQIWQRYGEAAVDLFASRENAHCPLFFSLTDDSAPLGVDALAHQWPNVLLYAFPPISLIIPTLSRVREKGLSMILIAPRWPSRQWIAEITLLLFDQPWPLPLRRDLLSQARGQIYHPHPEMVALWAWPVRGTI